jgi:hypothetical protein
MRPTSTARGFRWRIAIAALATVPAACATASPPAASVSPAIAVGSRPTASPSDSDPPTLVVEPIPEAAVVRIPVGAGPNTVAISSERIWVELHRADTLASVDPTTFEVTRHGDIPVHCWIASDGAQAVWTTIAEQSRVTKVDAATGKALAAIDVPDACGLSVAQDQVWVTSPGGSTIVRLDAATGARVRAVAVPEMPLMVTSARDVVYASGEGGGGWLRAFDAENGALVAERTTPERSMIDQLAFGSGSVWGTARLSPELARFDPRTLALEGAVNIGAEPSGVAATADAIWVTQLGGTLVRVDPATMTATHAWALEADWVAWPIFGFGRLWMSALEDDMILGVDLARLGT